MTFKRQSMFSITRLAGLALLLFAIGFVAASGCAEKKAPAPAGAAANTDTTPPKVETATNAEPEADANPSEVEMPAETAEEATKDMPADEEPSVEKPAATDKSEDELPKEEPKESAAKPQDSAEVTVEWNQWAGTPSRNNVPVGKNIPI